MGKGERAQQQGDNEIDMHLTACSTQYHKSFIANTFKTTPVLGVGEACSSDLSSRSAFAGYGERCQLVGTREKKMLWFFVRFCQVIKRKQKKKNRCSHTKILSTPSHFLMVTSLKAGNTKGIGIRQKFQLLGTSLLFLPYWFLVIIPV